MLKSILLAITVSTVSLSAFAEEPLNDVTRTMSIQQPDGSSKQYKVTHDQLGWHGKVLTKEGITTFESRGRIDSFLK